MRRTASLPLPLLLTALLLTGCTDPSPMPTPPPTPSATPVFASDEEALAAAEEAYRTYLTTVDAILANGGSDPERLLDMVSEEVYERELEGFKSYATNGWREVGSRTFILTLQQYDDEQVNVYSCDDISGTDVIDRSGASVVADDRQDRYAFEVTFLASEDGLIVSAKELWEGDGVCS